MFILREENYTGVYAAGRVRHQLREEIFHVFFMCRLYFLFVLSRRFVRHKIDQRVRMRVIIFCLAALPNILSFPFPDCGITYVDPDNIQNASRFSRVSVSSVEFEHFIQDCGRC